MFKFLLLACLLSFFETPHGQGGDEEGQGGEDEDLGGDGEDQDGYGVTPVDEQDFTVKYNKSAFNYNCCLNS